MLFFSSFSSVIFYTAGITIASIYIIKKLWPADESLNSGVKKNAIVPNEEQKKAIKILMANENVFLTGSAGVGKSFVINTFLESRWKKPVVLASTGAAAMLVKGRTFHSFFGVGIMEGGIRPTVGRAIRNRKVIERLLEVKEIIIDEISMIPADVFYAANIISTIIRKNDSPFGGIRIIVVGDFLQIPPVNPKGDARWLFQSQIWSDCSFRVVELTQTMRTSDQPFIDVLQKIRVGVCDESVKLFLNSRRRQLHENFVGTVIFGRRNQVEAYNNLKLNQNTNQCHRFETMVRMIKQQRKELDTESVVSQSPLPKILLLKIGALVMIRKNDPEGEYVNGSLGFVADISGNYITIKLLTKKYVKVELEKFQVLDAVGEPIAEVINFPLTLGWATTIHKAQGTSIDRIHMNLKNLWEPGQAYVAISRAKDPNQLFIEDWSTESIFADPDVIDYYSSNRIEIRSENPELCQ